MEAVKSRRQRRAKRLRHKQNRRTKQLALLERPYEPRSTFGDYIISGVESGDTLTWSGGSWVITKQGAVVADQQEEASQGEETEASEETEVEVTQQAPVCN